LSDDYKLFKNDKKVRKSPTNPKKNIKFRLHFLLLVNFYTYL